jgi:hypothetical protein
MSNKNKHYRIPKRSPHFFSSVSFLQLSSLLVSKLRYDALLDEEQESAQGGSE